MNKMNIGANTPVGSSPQSNSFPSPGIPISSAATQHIKPPSAPNTPITPSTSQPPTTAANAAAVAAAAAAAKNNGMFTFPAMNGQQPPQQSQQQPQQPQQPLPVAVQKPSAPSLDNDGVNRVLTKRKIQELVSQIDPAERLEPEVEDVRNNREKKREYSFIHQHYRFFWKLLTSLLNRLLHLLVSWPNIENQIHWK
jgi:transcription initiation factor TFIID subunit 12